MINVFYMFLGGLVVFIMLASDWFTACREREFERSKNSDLSMSLEHWRLRADHWRSRALAAEEQQQQAKAFWVDKWERN